MVLLWGEDPFLLRLAALELLAERGLRATEVSGDDWRGGETADLATPSLWGERRALLVSGAERLPEAGSREVLDYVRSPSPDALLVLMARPRGRSRSGLPAEVASAGGAVREVALRRQDLPRWLLSRAVPRGLQLSPAGAGALIGSIGTDPAALDQALDQLAAAFPGRRVGPDEVHAQFRGLGEQRVWDLCDHALAGRLPEALVALRGLLEGREDPLLILGSIASRVRDLIRVRDLPDRMPAAEAARAAGLRFDWQVRRYRDQASRFAPEELGPLHRAVVEADRALKGGFPPDVVLGTLVAAMAGQREAVLNVPVRVSR